VAIKKIRLKNSKEGLSADAIREIKLLQELEHPHVIKVRDIFNHDSNINIVMDLCTMDLEKVVRATKVPLRSSDVKQYMRMILLGVEHIHKNWILHRDIKPGNILIDEEGRLKLADFGLAKIFGSPDRSLSHQACTLWYRAPELLFGARSYGEGADMWAVGCIFAELMTRKPFLPGENELNQLSLIFAALGTPTPEVWPGMEQLPQFTKFQPSIGLPLKTMFGAASDSALDMLAGLLRFDPVSRLTATQCLDHDYFRQKPLPSELHTLPTNEQVEAAYAS
jgi:cyclin-dependent kinase 7